MRFSGIVATLFAATALAAPLETTEARNQKAAAIIKQAIPNLELLFALHPEVSQKLATQFPQFSENGAINVRVLESLPGDLIRDGLDLLLAVPRAVADVGLDVLDAGISAAGWVKDKALGGISLAAGVGKDILSWSLDLPRSIAGALIPWL
jgi:hypothetical protein